MAGILGLNNSIGWAHFQLKGGWKNTLIVASSYGIILAALVIGSIYLVEQTPGPSFMLGWTRALLALQMVVLILFAGSRIGSAIKADLTGRMIESHHLMPVPPAEAILSYLFGPTSQAMSLFAVNLLIGVFTANAAGVFLHRWLMANFVLLCFAIWTWSFFALAGFSTRGGFAWIAVLLLSGFGIQLIPAMPALLVLGSPFHRRTIFAMQTGGFVLDWAYIVSIAAQAFITLWCIHGAARKYVRADQPAFTPAVGLVLLATWVGLSFIGINYREEFQFFELDEVRAQTQFQGAALSAMLLAILPLGSAAILGEWWRRSTPGESTALDHKPLPLYATVLAAAGVIALLMMVVPSRPGFPDRRILLTAAAILAHCVAVGALLRLSHRIDLNPIVAVVFWLILSWLAPIFLDFLRHAVLAREYDDPVLQHLATFSPAGYVLLAWSAPRFSGIERAEITGMIGVVFQVVLALVMLAIERLTVRRTGPAIDQGKNADRAPGAEMAES